MASLLNKRSGLFTLAGIGTVVSAWWWFYKKQQPKECCVCYQSFRFTKILSCLHIVCSSCWKEWSKYCPKQHVTCPMCREPIICKKSKDKQIIISNAHLFTLPAGAIVIRTCIHCGVYIEKNGGCSSMICSS